MKPAPTFLHACILCCAHVAFPAGAQSSKSPVIHWSVGELKAAYLQCSDATGQTRLPPSILMGCSIVYEELKNRAFGGDFERLLTWSRSQRPRLKAD